MIPDYSGDFLQWLKGFYFIVQTGSFSRAGEQIGRRQSSVTYQLKKLEEALGVTLLHRKTTPIKLTQEGQKLFEIAQRIFDDLSQIETEVSHKHNYEGRICITANYGMAAHYLPYHILKFQEIYPHVEIDILPERTALIQQSYTAETSSFVITQQELLPQEAVFIPVVTAELALVMPKSWPTPSLPITLEYLSKQKFVGLVRELPVDQCVVDAFEKNNLPMNVVKYTGFFLTLLKYVSYGIGISILDRQQAETEGFDVQVHSLAHLFPERVYGIAYRPHQYIPPFVKAFIDYLKENGVEYHTGHSQALHS